MSRRYFRLLDDIQIPARWELGDPIDVSQGQEVDDPWMFREGRPVHLKGQLQVPIEHPGQPLDFSLAGVGVAPIVHARVGSVFTTLAHEDVQLIPVEISSQPGAYSLLVATRLIRCIDDKRSTEVIYWKPEDGRPERTGQYRDVYGMRIDASKVGNAQVFRTWGWDIALIVSEDIKQALERIGATGVKFNPV